MEGKENKMDILQVLIEEFQLKEKHVKNVIKLLDEGNTIPFIARYRKELTGGMEDTVIRDLSERLGYLRNLENRKEEVIRLIEEQGKLNDELKKEIQKAISLQRVEDLYRPFRPKRRTRATVAKEKGLEGLAELILKQELDAKDLQEELVKYIDKEKEINNEEEALQGAMDIIAEIVSDHADFRRDIKEIILSQGLIISQGTDTDEDSVYEMYYDYKEPIKSIANHRILAINRGEKEKKLRVNLYIEDEKTINLIKDRMITNPKSACLDYLSQAIEDGYKRLLYPSIEREIRNDLKERAEEEAINVFALNLEPLLMQAPVRGKFVMGIDPAYRTGCKVAVLDDTGRLLDYTVVYPTEPQKKVDKTKHTLTSLINKYGVEIIAIGNGTASRETEKVVAELLRELEKEVYYIIVNEAGASVYSASAVGVKEFPDLDVTIRGAISIGRRLQDPLAELVKIEPRHIGVGQYQHDLNQKRLNEALEAVVEDCVNRVGVDLNTASPSLLAYVAGISARVAGSIVDYRERYGKFSSRKQLLEVKGLGPKTFEQCAGFLRITDGDNPLDNTAVHPESYDIAEKLLEMEYKNMPLEKLAERLDVGKPTLKDIIEELEKPGRDPRDEMPGPILKQDVLSMEDLRVDMVLNGVVRNVVDFGAFIDIGVENDGLVHISQLSEKYIKHPKEVVTVGDIVEVKIIDIDKSRGRISLSMKDV